MLKLKSQVSSQSQVGYKEGDVPLAVSGNVPFNGCAVPEMVGFIAAAPTLLFYTLLITRGRV